MVLQQLVHKPIAAADALDEEAFGAVVEEKIEAEGDVAVPGEDDTQGDVLDEWQSTTGQKSSVDRHK